MTMPDREQAPDMPSPRQYERPALRVMTETEILNTFQITQAMATWWTNLGSPQCPVGC